MNDHLVAFEQSLSEETIDDIDEVSQDSFHGLGTLYTAEVSVILSSHVSLLLESYIAVLPFLASYVID